MRVWAALGGLILVAGCFAPDVPSGSFTCGEGGACPSGLTCDTPRNVCVTPGGTVADAPLDQPDARAVDAARPDARRDAAPGIDAPSSLPDGFMCTGGGFLGCKNEDTAFMCNAGGTGVVEQACPAGCDADNRRCLQCQPSTTLCSTIDKLVTCSAQGTIFAETTCIAGCDDTTSSPHACLVVTPLNLPADTCRSPGGTAPTFPPGRTTIDTDACTGGAKISQGNGLPDLCVWKYATLALGSGRTLDFNGTRIPVLVATSAMTVDGTIDVAGHSDEGGPGAAADLDGQGTAAPADDNGGGGGGGALTDGAAGGGMDAAAGGTAHERTRHLYPGGFGGIGGPCLLCERQSGGGGGGALNLVSCGTLRFGATAVINAGGGGGAGGGIDLNLALGGGGDGGGAGGEVLIEAAEISVEGGVLVANGGGGGGGATQLSVGKAGDDGALIAGPASGGPGTDGSGRGGDGGTGSGGTAGGLLPTSGAAAASAGPGAGGGGGAGGRLRALARPDKPLNVAPATIISPALIKGTVGRSR